MSHPAGVTTKPLAFNIESERKVNVLYMGNRNPQAAGVKLATFTRKVQ
jgi:hypothetical protein